jgi:hypothetical protein
MVPVLIQFHNQTTGRNVRKDLGIQPGGRWRRVTIDLMNDLTDYFEPAKYPVKHLDLFNQLSVYAGPDLASPP